MGSDTAMQRSKLLLGDFLGNVVSLNDKDMCRRNITMDISVTLSTKRNISDKYSFISLGSSVLFKTGYTLRIRKNIHRHQLMTLTAFGHIKSFGSEANSIRMIEKRWRRITRCLRRKLILILFICSCQGSLSQ